MRQFYLCFCAFFLIEGAITAQPLSGIYTINSTLPASASNYISFTAAITSLNTNGVGTSGVTFNVSSGQVFTEVPPPITTSGTSTGKIVFQKAGAGSNPIISGVNGIGTLASNMDGVIRIAGASWIIFDGINLEDNSSNATSTTQMEAGFLIYNSSPTLGSAHNIIRNCKVVLNRTNDFATGVYQSCGSNGVGFYATAITGRNDFNRYESIIVENAKTGINLTGTIFSYDSLNVITSGPGGATTIGSSTPDDINGTGIVISGQWGVEVSKCIIRNCTANATDISGININNDHILTWVFTPLAPLTDTTTVSGNLVYNIKNLNGSGIVQGIKFAKAIVARAFNNQIHSVSLDINPSTPSAAPTIRGIHEEQVLNSIYYFNSIRVDNNSAANASSTALRIASANTKVLLKNNVFANSTTASVSKHYAIYNLGTLSPFSSNNLYWSTGTNGVLGFKSGDKDSLWQWIGANVGVPPVNPIEGGSALANPNFVSATDLSFSGPTPASLSGTPVAGISADFYGNARDLLRPTIGAIETSQSLLDRSGPSISVSFISSVSPSVTAVITDNAQPLTGVVRLWYRMQSSSGAYTSLAPDVIPSGQFNGTYQWTTSLQALPNGFYSFYVTARDNAGQGANISVSPAPSTLFLGFGVTDPPNFASNPATYANTWTLLKAASLAGGTYPVGPTVSYLNLTAVANVLSGSELTGNVIFELQNNYDGTIGETFPIIFNQYLTSGGNWTATVRPATGVTGRETSGDPNGNTLIVFNGADRLTFDGRPGGAGASVQWLIRNKSIANFTPAIQFLNDALSDTLKFLQVESQNTLSGSTGGTIQFGTSTGNTGNSNNTVSNCLVRNRSDLVSVQGVGILSVSSASAPNSDNTILSNHVINFSSTGTTAGVKIAQGGGNGWRIDGNHFYMTMATPSSVAQTGIDVDFSGTAGLLGSNTVSNNYIGGSAASAGGAAWPNSGNTAWNGIVCKSNLTDSLFVTNNVIQNISKTGTGAGIFTGIVINGGSVSISGNTIGHNAVSNSISIVTTGIHSGIKLAGTGNAISTSIYNNVIANISSSTTNTTSAFRGVTIAGSAQPSIFTLTGYKVNNNLIHHLSTSANNTATGTTALTGIWNGAIGTFDISGNTISDLQATGSSATAQAIYMFATTSGGWNIWGNISTNKISNIAASNIIGVDLKIGVELSVTNNMILLGQSPSGTSNITGILDATAAIVKMHFNTINISGLSSGSNLTQCFKRTFNSTLSLKNNIFCNSIPSIDQFAINITNPVGVTADYNVYINNDTTIGLINYTPTSLLAWQNGTSPSQDIHTNTLPVFFTSATDLHLSGTSIGNSQLAGTPISGITSDIDGDLRGAFPYRGADEILSAPLSNAVYSISGEAKGEDAIVRWSVEENMATAFYEVEVSVDGQSFTRSGSMIAAGQPGFYTYSFTDVNANARNGGVTNGLYYRIKIVNNSGKFFYTSFVKVLFSKVRNTTVAVYPNPVRGKLTIEVSTNKDESFVYSVIDVSGRVLKVFEDRVNGHLVINESVLESLPPGIYLINVMVGADRKEFRIARE